MLTETVKKALARFDVGIYRLSHQPLFRETPDLSSLPRVDQVVDVGVAYGTPWLYDAFPDAGLLLVDPLPRNALVEQLLGAREHTYVEAACGSEPGHVDLIEDLGHPGRSSVLTRTALTVTGAETRTTRVAVRTLDEVVDEVLDLGPGRSVGLKVDTEGYELEVLRGARNTLAKAAFVICEVSVQRRFENSYRFEELVMFMYQQGFRVSEIVEAPPNAQGKVLYVDLAFLPEDA